MLKKLIFVGIILLAAILLFNTTCSAQTNYDDYAPIFYFESGEECYPIDADFQIDSSDLYKVGNSQPILVNIADTDLATYLTSDHYLDNLLGSPQDSQDIITGSENYEETNGNTVYYRVYSGTDATVIQYWMYYAFNKGEMNQHEGDWEMVQVVLENGNPSWVAYSQHHSSQWGTWSQVEKDGTHIKVYVARGSHANYLRSFSGKLGIASDIVGANGIILEPNDYTLRDLSTQPWLNYGGRWGQCGNTESSYVNGEALGNNGPEGPQFREDGNMWSNPESWGKSGLQANDMMFTAEWFIYNFVLIVVLITLAIIALSTFLIYRRHKKYGLGPRIVSMFYIDGLNLKSIGNILCIVGIVLAIISLFFNWYAVSVDISSLSSYTGIQTSGMVDIIKIHAIDGFQISIPSEAGFRSVAAMSLPFGILIITTLIFLMVATVGISQSKKLGKKYIWRGIRLVIPIILIIIVFASIGSLIPQSDDIAGNSIGNIMGSISSSPLGGQETFYVTNEGISVTIPMSWGLGLGLWLLLISGIILIISGAIEIISNSTFFQTKTPLPVKVKQKVEPPVTNQ